MVYSFFCFFFQAEDGIRYLTVTGVQTCALPISAAFEIVGDYSAIIELKAHCGLDEFGRHFEQLFGEGNELFDRKAAMPFVHRLRERIGDPGADADQCCLLDAEFARDLISRAEAD